MTLSDVSVADTAKAPCAAEPEGASYSCVFGQQDRGGGTGVAVSTGARASLDGFEIVGSASAGLVVADHARVTARRGTVTANAVGLNVAVPGYDMALLQDEVFVFGNGLDVAHEEMPLPTSPEVSVRP